MAHSSFIWLHPELILSIQPSYYLWNSSLILNIKEIDPHHLPSKNGAGLVDVHICSLQHFTVLPTLLFQKRKEISISLLALQFFHGFWFQNWMSSPPFHFPSLNQKFPLVFWSNFEHAPIASINSPMRDILYFVEVGPKVMIYGFGIVNKTWKFY